MKNNPLQILKPFALTILQYEKGLFMTILTDFTLLFTGNLKTQKTSNTSFTGVFSIVGEYACQTIGNSELSENVN